MKKEAETKRHLIVSDPRLLIDGSDLPVRRLLHSFLMLASRLQKLHAHVASLMGLTESQYVLLMSVRHLSATKKPNISELAKYLGLSHSFVTSQVTALCELKLLARNPDKEDGRVMLVSLTQDAFRLMDRSMPKIAKLNDVIFEDVPVELITALLPTVQKTIKNTDKALKLAAYFTIDPTENHEELEKAIEGSVVGRR